MEEKMEGSEEISGDFVKSECENFDSDRAKAETGTNSRDGNIKTEILKITKPFVAKKQAETLAFLRDEIERKKIDTPDFDFTVSKKAETVESDPKSRVLAEGQREHLYKIIVIGELGTGKTSIIKRYVHQYFSQHYRATIGVDFALKVLKWDQNTIIRLQLWDIAGQERFGNMTRVYYKEAVGAFIVFDVTRSATLEAVVKWKEDLDSKVQLSDGSPIPCILLGNKCDQPKEGMVNHKNKMDEYCREKGFCAWFETSAKENINIEEASRTLVNAILQNDKLLENGEQAKDMDKFVLDWRSEKGMKNSCWC